MYDKERACEQSRDYCLVPLPCLAGGFFEAASIHARPFRSWFPFVLTEDSGMGVTPIEPGNKLGSEQHRFQHLKRLQH